MEKLPTISMGYECLRNSVCKFCASAPYPDTRSVHPNREAVPVSELFTRSVSDDYLPCEKKPTGLWVYANVAPVYDLFWLAVGRDRVEVPGGRFQGCTRLNLLPAGHGRTPNQFRDTGTASLVAFVCWQSADGFAVGPDPYWIRAEATWDGEDRIESRGALRFEPGYALLVWGGEAVAIFGFVAGRPFALTTDKGAQCVDQNVFQEGIARKVREWPNWDQSGRVLCGGNELEAEGLIDRLTTLPPGVY